MRSVEGIGFEYMVLTDKGSRTAWQAATLAAGL